MLRVVLAHHIEQRHALRVIIDGWECVLLCHPGITDAAVGVGHRSCCESGRRELDAGDRNEAERNGSIAAASGSSEQREMRLECAESMQMQCASEQQQITRSLAPLGADRLNSYALFNYFFDVAPAAFFRVVSQFVEQ